MVSRRGFFGSLAAALAVPFVAAVRPVEAEETYGLIRAGRTLGPFVTSVTVDGKPLNIHRCIAANDRKGWVLKYVEYDAANGGKCLRPDPRNAQRLHKEIVRGRVRITIDKQRAGLA